jgi:2-hydroxychromene-2-carboxylate isomerase
MATPAAPTLTVLFDPKDPYSYLAMGPTLALIRDAGVDGSWYPFLGRPIRAAEEPGDEPDRGALHRWHRACYQERDLVRYAAARNVPARHFADGGLYRSSEAEVAAVGFNWARRDSAARALDYLDRVFTGYWDGAMDVDSVADIEAALAAAGVAVADFAAYAAAAGRTELTELRARLVERGAFTAPAILFEDEAYVGRQHLAYLRHRLGVT